jgi:hypothetical protein
MIKGVITRNSECMCQWIPSHWSQTGSIRLSSLTTLLFTIKIQGTRFNLPKMIYFKINNVDYFRFWRLRWTYSRHFDGFHFSCECNFFVFLRWFQASTSTSMILPETFDLSQELISTEKNISRIFAHE